MVSAVATRREGHPAWLLATERGALMSRWVLVHHDNCDDSRRHLCRKHRRTLSST